MQGKVEICGVNTALLPRLGSAETEELLRRAGAAEVMCAVLATPRLERK